MKRNMIMFGAVLFCFSFFTACSTNQFKDLSGFVYSFNRAGDVDIDLEDVNWYTEEKEVIYQTFFEDDTVILKLICENDRINELRVAFSKKDGNGRDTAASAETISEFTQVAKNSIIAFCGYDRAKAETIMNELKLNNKTEFEKTGELTETKDNFHFVYLSDSFVSKLIIYNTYLKEVPQTEKPVSKPAFGNTTNVRNE